MAHTSSKPSDELDHDTIRRREFTIGEFREEDSPSGSAPFNGRLNDTIHTLEAKKLAIITARHKASSRIQSIQVSEAERKSCLEHIIDTLNARIGTSWERGASIATSD